MRYYLIMILTFPGRDISLHILEFEKITVLPHRRDQNFLGGRPKI